MQRTIANLNGRSQVQAFEAAKAIWKDSDPRLERPLILLLKKGRRPFNRAAAAFAMQTVRTLKTIAALERTLSDKSEYPRLRGEAAEALAHAHRKKSHHVLLKNLTDRSKEVRFWCAFALGEMAERRAIAELTRLSLTDKRVVRGFHSVAKEAADVLENIRSEKKAHRTKGGCVFCCSRNRDASQ